MGYVTLNNKPLNETVFTWPLYRGVEPRVQVLTLTPERLQALGDIPLAGNTIEFVREPGKSPLGASGEAEKVVAKNVFVDIQRPENQSVATIQLADCRLMLSRAVCETAQDRGEEVLTYINRAWDDLRTKADWLPELVPPAGDAQAATVPDDVRYYGRSFSTVLAELLQLIGLDFTVSLDGAPTLINVSDVDRNQRSVDVPWHVEPPWVSRDAKGKRNLTPALRMLFPRREQFWLRFSTRRGSVAQGGETLPGLEQVYEWRGQWVTEIELESQWTRATRTFLDVNDATVAKYYPKPALEGLYEPVDKVDAQAQTAYAKYATDLIATVQANYRTAFRVGDEFAARVEQYDEVDTLAYQRGDDGAALPNVTRDGSVVSDYVAWYETPVIVEPGTLLGAIVADTNDINERDLEAAPFVSIYAPSAGIVKLQFAPGFASRRLKGALPGRLKEPITIKIQQLQAQDTEGANYGAAGGVGVGYGVAKDGEIDREIEISVSFIGIKRGEFYAVGPENVLTDGGIEIADMRIPAEFPADYNNNREDEPTNLAQIEQAAERWQGLMDVLHSNKALEVGDGVSAGALFAQAVKAPIDAITEIVIECGTRGPGVLTTRVRSSYAPYIEQLTANATRLR